MRPQLQPTVQLSQVSPGQGDDPSLRWHDTQDGDTMRTTVAALGTTTLMLGLIAGAGIGQPPLAAIGQVLAPRNGQLLDTDHHDRGGQTSTAMVETTTPDKRRAAIRSLDISGTDVSPRLGQLHHRNRPLISAKHLDPPPDPVSAEVANSRVKRFSF